MKKVGGVIIYSWQGYHMGYNTGNNVAESTNFASDRWVGFGMNYVVRDKGRERIIEGTI